MAVIVLAVALTAVAATLALWPPLWAPEAWRSCTRRLRHRVRRRRYRGIDLKRPPLTTSSFPSNRGGTDQVP